MEINLEKIVSFIASCIFFGLFLWVHLIPFTMSLRTIKYLKNRDKEYSPYILLSIISIIPTLIFLYLVYFALTCGSACFNGIIFFMSLTPVLVLSIVNQIIKNYVYKTYRIQLLKDNTFLERECIIKEKEPIIQNKKEDIKKLNPLIAFVLFCFIIIFLFKLG